MNCLFIMSINTVIILLLFFINYEENRKIFMHELTPDMYIFNAKSVVL